MDPIGTVPDLDSGRIALGGRQLELRLTRAARKALAGVSGPLTIELELYFSCLIRKRVRFLDAPHEDSAACAALGPKVQICFRPVMTKACFGGYPPEPELESFPARNPTAFIPKWLALDWRGGAWSGEFGY